MQISGAGEGGRVAGREPARPARAVAHEPFRLGDREAARTVRTTPREVDARARPGSETKPADTRNEAKSAEAKQAEARQAERRQADQASDARSRRDRADDAAETAARRKDVVAKDRANKDKATRDAAADDGMRKDVAAKSAAAAGATPLAADPDAAQAEAVRAAAGETAETDDADEPETEGDAPDGTPTLISAALAAPIPTAPATGTAAAPGATPAEPGADAAAIQPAATSADPRIAALMAEASKAGGSKDPAQEGGGTPAPDGLAAPDPSAPAPQAKGADAATQAAAETRPAVSVQAPLSAVPLTIGMRALAGANRFEIRLDPYELGRIDVRLDIDRQHGAVKAHLVVERPETLALLQRDAASLQQALSQAGLDPGEAGLSFSLRDGGGQNPQRDQAGQPPGPERATSVAAEAEAQGLPPLRNLGQRLGLDLRI
ncbi:flagellar hook-length control protein FliK [Methylobacterium sp. EM32]|uniref:flagellar hook-length control protein FliK n=1 Tax=Methylobacterium sp. EM32 TaxID=3163481 RepID=UPI0033BCE895